MMLPRLDARRAHGTGLLRQHRLAGRALGACRASLAAWRFLEAVLLGQLAEDLGELWPLRFRDQMLKRALDRIGVGDVFFDAPQPPCRLQHGWIQRDGMGIE